MKFNSTPFELMEIETWPLLVTVRNEWRQRLVTVYSHPTEDTKVITVGKPFNGGEPIICLESRDDWATCLAGTKFQVYK